MNVNAESSPNNTNYWARCFRCNLKVSSCSKYPTEVALWCFGPRHRGNNNTQTTSTYFITGWSLLLRNLSIESVKCDGVSQRTAKIKHRQQQRSQKIRSNRKRNDFNFKSLNNVVIVPERNDHNKVRPHSAVNGQILTNISLHQQSGLSFYYYIIYIQSPETKWTHCNKERKRVIK